jgi:hypothetical protein
MQISEFTGSGAGPKAWEFAIVAIALVATTMIVWSFWSRGMLRRLNRDSLKYLSQIP